MIFLLKIIFPYVAIFYILDCFVFIKRNHIAFSSNFGKKFGLKQQGIRFIGFSPICQFYYATQLPFFANEKWVIIWNKESLNALDLYEEKFFYFFSFDEIKDIECIGEYIQINNSKRINLNSSYLAKSIAEKIMILKECPVHLRNERYKNIFENLQKINILYNDHHNLFYIIQFVTAMLFILVFILLPCFIYLDVSLKIDVLVFEILLFYILTIGMSLYLYRRIHKKNKCNFILFFHLIFSPVSAIHVIHMITKDITFNVDWIELSAYILSPENFKKILVKELKRLHFSKVKCKNAALNSFILLKEKQYKSYLLDVGINHEIIFEPPQQKDSSAHSYCPLCETEFQNGVYKCSECDIELSIFGNNKK